MSEEIKRILKILAGIKISEQLSMVITPKYLSMTHFFARLYEWFGLVPVYSHDMAEFLKGLDVSCVGYFALPWYFYVGVISVVFTFILFGLQYDIISGTRFKKNAHWELTAVMVAIVCFFTAFTIPAVALLTRFYCPALNISIFDCIGFGLSNAVWSVILFSALSLVQKGLNRSSSRQ